MPFMKVDTKPRLSLLSLFFNLITLCASLAGLTPNWQGKFFPSHHVLWRWLYLIISVCVIWEFHFTQLVVP